MFFFRLLNNSSPFVFFLLPIVTVLLWSKALFTGSYYFFAFDDQQMPFYYFFSRLIGGNLYLNVFWGFLLFALQVALLIRLNIKYIFIENRSFLPAFFFIFIVSSFYQLQRINPALFANIFVLFAIDRLFRAYRRENTFSEVFDVFFLLATSSLFYFNMIYFILFFWIAFVAIKPFKIMEWVVSLIGIITPYFFAFSYYYFTDQHSAFVNLILSNLFLISSKIHYMNIYYYIYFAFIFLMVLLSIFYFLQGITIKKIVTRKYYTIFILLIIACIIGFFVLRSASTEMIIITGMPVSIMISFFLLSIKKKLVKEIWIVSFLTLMVIAQLFK